MLKRALSVAIVVAFAGGCSKNESGAGPTSAPSGSTEVQPEPLSSSGSTSGTPGPVSGANTFTHLEPQPKRQPSKCQDLPEGRDTPLRQLVTVTRQLACEPELFYLPIGEIRKKLGVGNDYPLVFGGPASIRIEFSEKYEASEVAEAIGVQAPVARMSTWGPWRSFTWWLGSNSKTGELDVWGPGDVRMNVDVDHTGVAKGVEVTPVKTEVVERWVIVKMPDAAVPVKDDATAVELLVRAVEAVAKDRGLLEGDVEQVAARLGLASERFRVKRASEGSKSIDIAIARSRVGAAPLLEKLQLTQEKIRHREGRDTVGYVLSGHQHTYKDVRVDLSFRRRTSGVEKDPAHFTLDELTIFA